jgi:hypothetical protein
MLQKIATLVLVTFLFLYAPFVQAQTNAPVDSAYLKTIQQRAEKIVATLEIKKGATAIKVRDIIQQQYGDLKALHEQRDVAIKKAKAEKKGVEETGRIQGSADSALAVLHKVYLKRLSAHLSKTQIDKVKNGMTYNVLPITYKGYQDMILTLTEEQKKQILVWLTEAREHAMDAGTSEEKHKWFGKYKGRINNYLSAAGYDLKKEGDEWERRRKATAANAK